MNAFQTKLISTFKSFVAEETNLELDFRTHVFLENQYGAYPQYSYIDAEKVIDCMFNFFDKYHVDYAGRYNRSMSIESLRTQKLNNFLLEHLEQEIEKVIFNAIENDTAQTKMVITAISIADFCEEGSTIEVKTKDLTGTTTTFYVQTTDGEYRSDLGCWVTTLDSSDDINPDDYPLLDIAEIIYQAEKFITETNEIEWAKANIYTITNKNSGECEVVEENPNFINSVTSSYQRRWDKSHGKFENKDEAQKHIATL